MVPIIRLRRTKKTVGVNQLFIDAHTEDGIAVADADADSSSIVVKVFCWLSFERIKIKSASLGDWGGV